MSWHLATFLRKSGQVAYPCSWKAARDRPKRARGATLSGLMVACWRDVMPEAVTQMRSRAHQPRLSLVSILSALVQDTPPMRLATLADRRPEGTDSVRL